MSALRPLTAKLRKKQVKILLTTPIQDQGVRQKLMNLGITEILGEPISVKSLDFKVDRHVKMMAQEKRGDPFKKIREAQKKGGADKNSPEIFTIEKDRKEKRGFGSGDTMSMQSMQPKLTWLSPLNFESECWAVGNYTPRRIGGKWVVKVHGPSPEDGRWVEIGERGGVYQWMPSEPKSEEEKKNAFIKNKGAWIFEGQEPRTQDESWLFVGKRVALQFYEEQKVLATRFSNLESVLELKISKDIEPPDDLMGRIEDSWQKFYRHREEERESKEKSIELEREKRRETEDLHYQEEKETSKPLSFEDHQEERRTTEIHTLEPLRIREELFCVQENMPSRVSNEWVVTCAGPSPEKGGQWIEVKREGQKSWEWSTGKDKSEMKWVFFGNKPSFRNGAWVFSAAKPILKIYSPGGALLGRKFYSEDGWDLFVCMDVEDKRNTPDFWFQEEKRKTRYDNQDPDRENDVSGQEVDEGAEAEESLTPKKKKKSRTQSVEAVKVTEDAADFDDNDDEEEKEEAELIASEGNSVEGEHGPAEAESDEDGIKDGDRKTKTRVTVEARAQAEAAAEARRAEREREKKEKAEKIAQKNREEQEVQSKAREERSKEREKAAAEKKAAEAISKEKVSTEKKSSEKNSPGKNSEDKKAAAEKDNPEKVQGKEAVLQAKVAKAHEKEKSAEKKKADEDNSDEEISAETSQEKSVAREKSDASAKDSSRTTPDTPDTQDTKVAKDTKGTKATKKKSEKDDKNNVVSIDKKKAVSEKFPFPKGTPEKPSLSPLALAFLVSELVSMPKVSREDACKNFCGYLSFSCGGAAVEIRDSRSTVLAVYGGKIDEKTDKHVDSAFLSIWIGAGNDGVDISKVETDYIAAAVNIASGLAKKLKAA